MVYLCCDYLDGCFVVVVMADALPPLICSVWRMLCRRVCAAYWSSLADASPPWSSFFWWILGHPLVVFIVSVGGLGDVVLYVGSSVLGHLDGLGGLVRFSLLFCGRRSASFVAVCLRWPCFSFFSIVSPLCACAGQLLFGQHQVMSVTYFPLNEIRAKACSRKIKFFQTSTHNTFFKIIISNKN